MAPNERLSSVRQNVVPRTDSSADLWENDHELPAQTDYKSYQFLAGSEQLALVER